MEYGITMIEGPALKSIAVVRRGQAVGPAAQLAVVGAGPAHAPAAPKSLDRLLTSVTHEFRFADLLHQNHYYNWLILLGAIFVGVALGRLVASGLRRVGARLESKHRHFQALLTDGAAGPANLFIFTSLLLLGMSQLYLTAVLWDIVGKAVLLLTAIAFFWYLFNVVGVVELALKRFIVKHDTPITEQILPIVRKTLRIFVAIIGALFILQEVFGRDIGSWLAGLGIAGLAVSLAAQDSLKNFFGSITILLDRPYLVGHWIQYKNSSGTVEEIGFRSTRLRQFDGVLVTIPNSDVVNNSVQNYTRRPFIRRALNVTVPYDTPPEKVRQAVQIIKTLLASAEFRANVHDPADPQSYPPRVFFNEFKAESLNIQVYYYYRPASDYWGYMAFSERFNFALMQAYEQAGIEFAFPTRTLYLAGDPKRKLSLAVEGADGVPTEDGKQRAGARDPA